MKTDVIVFGAHPDDAELAMGGTITKLTSNGLNVGLIDLTQGEMGTRGDLETRNKEATKAASILNASFRENLKLQDGNIELTRENSFKVIASIRKYKPKIVFAPYFKDRHPDHIKASQLVKEALFYSGLSKLQILGKNSDEAYRPEKLFYYMQSYTFDPSFIIDIDDYFENKMKAIKAFKTQFHDPTSSEPETFISRPEFLNFIESRALFYGFKIGKKYGEAFYCEEEIELDLINFLK
jgi:bacillithiol biosynthesis deacetylase BshB1